MRVGGDNVRSLPPSSDDFRLASALRLKTHHATSRLVVPIALRSGSGERVVLPVPERPNEIPRRPRRLRLRSNHAHHVALRAGDNSSG